MLELPEHLKKYKVDQNYSRYTPIDQATWRYILRQLKDFLSVNAHECYLDGLVKTGISEEEIPRIEEMSAKLEKFGWYAMPVSGFIPPAAFMELQSLSILPIASDMRSLEHLLYTPAPDIVHEAAGHAPILIDPEYAAYLKEYAQVAKKAIISKEDLDLYESIRNLSDVKENPLSTAQEIANAEAQLQQTIKAISHISEATELSRMNWWTAEYGLIGDINKPKIFGAGLLSSVGESKWCLSNKVKKIPLSVNCIKQSYDITEPQPQLFVTPDFKTLVRVLHDMADNMAYKVGGEYGIKKAILAKTVNTIELDNGLQISGVITEYITNTQNEIIFFKTTGPSQICYKDKEISEHNKEYHLHVYSSHLGLFNSDKNIVVGETIQLNYASGFVVTGEIIKIQEFASSARILTLKNATATYENKTYFEPAWGNYDIVLGQTIKSVFGGPADRKNYGETDDFVAARVPEAKYTIEQQQIFKLYQKIRDYRKSKNYTNSQNEVFYSEFLKSAPHDWLLFIELLEITIVMKSSANSSLGAVSNLDEKIKEHLNSIKSHNEKLTSVIDDGVRLAYAKT